MTICTRLLTALLTLSALVSAQDTQAPYIFRSGIFLGGSFDSAIHGSGLPPGAIFVLKGAWLGPDELVAAQAPYPTALPAGSEDVRVQFRSVETGETAEAELLHVWSFQVSGIVPKSLPIGAVEITVYRGELASEPVETGISVPHFGAFTLGEDGRGHAIAQIYRSPGDLPLQSLTNPIRPGDRVILWGTGLPVGVPPANGGPPARVYLGDVETITEYAGDAPGLPGVGQINILVPEDAELPGHCYTELRVWTGDLQTSHATVATGGAEGPCSHPWGLSNEQLAALDRGEGLPFLNVSADLSGPYVTEGGGASLPRIFANALFAYVDAQYVARNSPTARETAGPSASTCSRVTAFSPGRVEGPPNLPAPPIRPHHFERMDVGEVTITGPDGDALPLAVDELFQGSWIATAPLDAAPTGASDWTLRVSGGADFGPWERTFHFPDPELLAPPPAIVRGQEVTTTWPPEAFDPGDRIRVTVLVPQGEGESEGIGCLSIPASDGGFVFNAADTADIPESPDGEARWSWTVAGERELIEVPGFDRAITRRTSGASTLVPLQ